MSDPIGTTIGGYRVEALAGEGSLGRVYRAVDAEGRLVALRLFAISPERAPELESTLAAAIPRMAALRHPGLAIVYAAGVVAGVAYVAEEWLPDRSLGELLEERERLQLVDLLDIVLQAADALSHAHAAGIAHGALTPRNLMLTPRLGAGRRGYRVRLADWGLLALLETGHADPLPLSPAGLTYALSPEHCQGLPADAQGDIYSLGAILYRLATGQPPFQVDSLDSAVYAHVYQRPAAPRVVDPRIPEELEAIILRCLAKRPEERYPTAGDLAAELALVAAALKAGPAQILAREAPANTLGVSPAPEPTPAPAGLPLPAPSRGLASVGQYTLERLLDEDDLGQRYQGRGPEGDRVTVRLLPRALSADPGFRADFEQQAARLVGLNHRNLADVITTGAAGGRCYVVGGAVDGPTLRSALDIRGADQEAWPLDRLLGFVVDAADALGAAHRIGLIHGGLRPARLALTSDGVRVCDLGLESLVVSAGEEETVHDRETLIYALAPERCQGLGLSARSDVYALGVILYEVLAGRTPFEAATLNDAIAQHIYQPLVPPRQLAAEVPPEIELVVLRCLSRRPEDRFANGSELADALRAAFAVRPTASQPAPLAEQPQAPGQPPVVRPVRAIVDPDTLVGTTFAGCQVEKHLGLSETGSVYKVRHVDLDRPLALKLIDPELARTPGFQRAFDREAARIATLRHQNIAELFDIGYQDGSYYLLMEWLPDGTFRNVLQARSGGDPAWPLATVLDLLRQAADGLSFSHRRGYIHGLIKPNNMLLHRQDGLAGQPPVWTLKLADCGFGKLVDVGERPPNELWADTLIYTLAPERAEGQPIDVRSDIYAMGAILYQAVTGNPPFEAKTVDAAVQKHLYAEPMPPSSLVPDTPVELEQLILRCLAKAPADRFQTAAELSAAIQAVLVSPALAPPTRVARAAPEAPSAPAPFAPAVAPWVVVLDQYGRELRRAPLSGDGISVGRAPGNDVVLEEAAVRDRHLQIDWDGQQPSVTSLALDAGTILGESHMAPQRSYPWPAATTLRLAGYWLQLDSAPPPAQATPPPGAQEGAEVDPGALADERQSSPEAPAPAQAIVSHIGVILEQEQLVITPGRAAMFRLTVTNMGSRVDHLTISVEGVPAAWVQRLPPVQLNPGGQQLVTLSVTVPEEPESRAGLYPVVVKASSRENAANLGTATAQWTVQPYQRASVVLRPRLARGWRTGKYRLSVTNEGNAPARFAPGGEDDEGVLDYDFTPGDPPTIEPGATARVQLRLRAQQMRWFGAGQRHNFNLNLKALGEGGPLQTMGTFEQRVVLPAWLLPVMIGLAALTLLYGLAAPPLMAPMPYYRFLNPTLTPTRTPPPTPTFAPTATRVPTATPSPTFTATPVVPTATLAPTLPPTAVPPPPPPPTITPTFTPSPTATIGPACLAGSPVFVEGIAPPGVPLILVFDGRTVGGGLAGADGRYRIRLDPGSERPGLYPVTVQIRGTGQVLQRITCVIPTPVPTIGPPTPPPSATPVDTGD
jgi:serine/threonine protein kinase